MTKVDVIDYYNYGIEIVSNYNKELNSGF